MESQSKLFFWLGVCCFAASLLVLVFQKELGEILGVWFMGIWLALGGAGVYFIGKGRDESDTHL
jgi:hypothetical protein